MMPKPFSVPAAQPKRGAVIDGIYRYRLWREVDPAGKGTVTFIMLNPSTADASADDPTIRKCLGFANMWGFATLEVCNLFALRATDPDALKPHSDPVGPRNDEFLQQAATNSGLIIAAWGTKGALRGREKAVAGLFKELHCLRTTKAGHPEHPLYLPYSLKPAPWMPR